MLHWCCQSSSAVFYFGKSLKNVAKLNDFDIANRFLTLWSQPVMSIDAALQGELNKKEQSVFQMNGPMLSIQDSLIWLRVWEISTAKRLAPEYC